MDSFYFVDSKNLLNFANLVKEKQYKPMAYNMWQKINQWEKNGWSIRIKKVDFTITVYSLMTPDTFSFTIDDNSFGTYLFYKYFDVTYDSCSSWTKTVCKTEEDNNITTTYKTENFIPPSFSPQKKKEEREKDMKTFNFDFGPCTGDAIRMSPYGLAVKNASGTYVSYDSKTKEIIDVDIFNFDGTKFLYKVPAAIKDIKPGDVVIHNRKPMVIINTDNSITCVDTWAGEKKVIMPTKSPFGFDFITKIVSLLDFMPKCESTAENPFGNMLPFFMMSDSDTDPVMLMMMMSGGKFDMSNPMMMYFLMKDGKNADMLPLILMMNKS